MSCLDRIELATREFAAKYLGYDPNQPSGVDFPMPDFDVGYRVERRGKWECVNDSKSIQP